MLSDGRKQPVPAALSCGAVLLAAALFVPSGPARGQSFEEWDIDGNGAITPDEFRLGMGTLGVYMRWDTDHDGMLADEEYRARPPLALADQDADFWNAWDLDGDDLLDHVELQRGFYSAYDRDGDDRLDLEEWRAFRADAEARGWIER